MISTFPTNAKLQTSYTKQKFHQILETIMEKHTTEPVKVHLSSNVETIRNHSIMKNIGQIQNTGKLENSKHNPKYNFVF